MQFLTNLDLSKNELQNAVIQPLATAPANPKLGQIYFDTALGALMQYKTSGWKRVGVVYNQVASTGAVVAGLDEEGNVTTKNVIELTLTGYTPVEGGVVAAGASIGTAIHDIDEELKNVIAGGGEPNQEAFSYISDGTNTISATAKKDTFKVVGTGAASVGVNSSNKTITVDVGVDGAMSTTSTNPVQNKVVKAAIDAAASAAVSEAEGYTDTKDTAMGTRVGAVETRMTAAEGDIDALETLVGSTSVASQISTAIAAEDALAQGYASAAETAAKNYADEAVGDLDDELATVAKSGAAADVSIVDAAGKLTADNVEAAIAELITMIDAGGSGSVVTVEKNTSVEGIAARYTIKQGGTAVTGGVIDIPKDMVVKQGYVETDPEDMPAGTYLVLVLQNATEDKVYINVSSLIEYVTAGEDTATGHVTISADHKVQMNVIAGSIGATQLDSTTNTKLAVVDTLNGSASTEGSVKYQIAAAKADVETEIDNLKNGEVADNTAAIEALDGRVEAAEDDIDTLEGLVGSTSVASQIATAKAAVEAEITALEEGAVADNTAAIAALDESKADKSDVEEIPVVKAATGTLAAGGTSASVGYTGTVVNCFVKDASGNEVVTDITIGASTVTFTVAQAAASALTCTVIYF